jgi:hypothetical protein
MDYVIVIGGKYVYMVYIHERWQDFLQGDPYFLYKWQYTLYDGAGPKVAT